MWAKPNLPIQTLRDSCAGSDLPRLLKLKPSRCLYCWWIGLHLLVALSLFTLWPLLGWAVLPLLLWHFRRHRPQGGNLLLLLESGRVALPDEARFDLPLTRGTTAGSGWIDLVFRPGAHRLILRDQLDPADWRRLRLFIGGGA